MNNHWVSLALVTLFVPWILHAQSPAKPSQTEIQVKKGQYIRDTAAEIYGHHDFEGLIILYNHLASGRATFPVSQLIKSPPVGQIFRESKMDPKYLEVIDEMITVSTEYYDVTKQFTQTVQKYHLRTLGIEGHPGSIKVPVSEETLSKAADLEKRLVAAENKFKSSLKKGQSTPTSFLRNLEGARQYLHAVASGIVDENCYDVDMVSQRLGHAFTNALIWTREHYK